MANLEKPITTQEELDALISDRLRRERETSAKRYEGFLSPEDKQTLINTHAAEVQKLTDSVTDLQNQLKTKDEELAASLHYRTDLEKTRIALAAGLKPEYADRLRGEPADDWEADAEILAKDFKAAHVVAPQGNPDPIVPGSSDNLASAYQTLLETLKGE